MTPTELLRGDLRIISGLVPEKSRVLDLGCGDGALLEHLRDEKDCVVRGVELSGAGVAACIEHGIPVVQADLDAGLAGFPDDRFDFVVLSQTLQVVRRPALVLGEMLRVGRRGIISFPNFAHWRARSYLALRGRMPMSRAIPYTWYETPNIHHTTLKDFRDFCEANGARVLDELTLGGSSNGVRTIRVLPNLRAETIVAVVARDPSADATPTTRAAAGIN